MPIFDHAHPITIKETFRFPNFYEHAKNQLDLSYHSQDTTDFKVPQPKRQCPFLTRLMQ